jgi:hypothetical protein
VEFFTMMRRISVFAVVLALSFAAATVQAAPMFWLSAEPTDTTVGNIGATVTPSTAGTINIFANSDVRLAGISLDLMATGTGIRFTGVTIPNPNQRWAFTSTPTVADSQILSIEGAAIPGLVGGGVGTGAPDAGPGILFATVEYMSNASGRSDLQLGIGGNRIADWTGAFPMVALGEGPADIDGSNVDAARAAGFISAGGGPEPLVAADAALGDTAAAIINHMFTATGGTAPLTWGNLQSTGPGTPVVAATLSPTGQFQWHTEGSVRPAMYSWTATVTDSANPALTDTATLTLNLIVPEPATMSLIGIAMVGLVGLFARRR